MRRLAVIAPLVLLAGALAARWRRRVLAARRPLDAPPRPAPPVALLEPPSRFVSVPWTLVAAPDDRAQLTLRCAGDPRLELDRVDAQETPTQVFVTVLMRRRAAAADTPAPEQQQEHEATVALSSPLGERALVHAPVDADADAPPADAPADADADAPGG